MSKLFFIFLMFRYLAAFFLPLLIVIFYKKRNRTDLFPGIKTQIFLILLCLFVLWFGIPNVGDSDPAVIGNVEKNLAELKWQMWRFTIDIKRILMILWCGTILAGIYFSTSRLNDEVKVSD